MNESDTDANTKAIDSLLNFETVNISAPKTARRRDTTRRWRDTSGRACDYVSLAVLNAGQAFICTSASSWSS